MIFLISNCLPLFPFNVFVKCTSWVEFVKCTSWVQWRSLCEHQHHSSRPPSAALEDIFNFRFSLSLCESQHRCLKLVSPWDQKWQPLQSLRPPVAECTLKQELNVNHVRWSGWILDELLYWEKPGHPEVVSHINPLSWSNLEFPLRRHHLICLHLLAKRCSKQMSLQMFIHPILTLHIQKQLRQSVAISLHAVLNASLMLLFDARFVSLQHLCQRSWCQHRGRPCSGPPQCPFRTPAKTSYVV